jgi:hypothetical protein
VEEAGRRTGATSTSFKIPPNNKFKKGPEHNDVSSSRDEARVARKRYSGHQVHVVDTTNDSAEEDDNFLLPGSTSAETGNAGNVFFRGRM